MSDSTGAGSVLEEVSTFLAHEAHLADSHAYDEWLSLWTPDACYWVPCNEDDYDPMTHVSIIYDDYARLQERCFRLSVGGAHAQEPRSRLCRVLGNVRLVDPDPAAAALTVDASMILLEVRSGLRNVYGAHCRYVLRRSEEGLRIQSKKVVLLDNDEPLGNLAFLL